MTLKERLLQFNEDDQLQIGSKSAYFFMGTKDEFLESLKDLDVEWKEKFRMTVQRTQTNLAYMKAHKPKENDGVIRKIWDNGRQRQMTLEEAIADWEKRISRTERNLELNKNALKEFTTFASREVKEVYKNIDKTAYIVIIDGYEAAKFWTRVEWDRYKNGETIIIDSSEEDEDDEDI